MTKAKLAIGVLLAIGVVAAFSWLPLGEGIAHVVRFVRGMGVVGIALYSVLFVVSAILLVPTTPVFVAAGLLYGLVWGAVLLTALSIVTDLITRALVRTRARGWIESRIERHGKLRAVDTAVREHSLLLGSLLRLSLFVPFGPLNYALGATRMPVWKHVVTNTLGMTPCNVLMAYAGSLISDAARLDTSALPGMWKQLALWGGLLVTVLASVAIALATRNVMRRRESEGVVRDHVANA